MKCTCPKCHATIELSLPPDVADKGAAASCPACNAKFNVVQESFAGRAFQRSGEISCSACGSLLGPEISCTNCGILYPDYLVAGGRRKDAGRGAKVKLKSSPFKKRASGSDVDIMPLEEAMKDKAPAAAPQKKAAPARPYEKLIIPGALLVLVVLLAVGAGFYSQKKTQGTYMKSYVRVAYGIQIGEDSSRKICQRIAADWKAKLDAGQAFNPRPTMEEEKELTVIKTKLESMKGNLPAEPEQFKNSTDKLAKLEGAYTKLRGLALSPGASLPAFTDSYNKLDTEYKKAAGELRAGLPKKLMDEMTAGAQKFRGLRPLLKE